AQAGGDVSSDPVVQFVTAASNPFARMSPHAGHVEGLPGLMVGRTVTPVTAASGRKEGPA
ncbi:MAG: hypothetical protein M3Q03_09320, partial [Chloroflexota bacterium]|nr:hypothetical protein [Chloroflexota bacterium]